MTATLRRRRTLYRSSDGTRPADRRPVALFLYTRISRDPEGRELGVQRQTSDLGAWAEQVHPDAEVFDGRTAAHPGGYCDNDLSASTRTDTERPNYDRVLADARAAAVSGTYSRVIVAAYTSARLTRRPREYEGQIDLAENFGVEYYFLRSPSFDLNTAAGRRIGRIMAANDAGDVETSAELILRAKEQQALDGVFSGGTIPFGYRVERDMGRGGLPVPGSQRLVIDEREAEAIRDGARAFLAGTSLGAIGTMWMERGLTTKRGGRWLPTNVRRVLERGRTAGVSERYGEEMGAGQWPAIITEDESAAVRAKLADPKRRKYEGEYGRKWLGGRLYRCGQPGCTKYMRSMGGGGRGAETRYCCQDGHCTIKDAPAIDMRVRSRVAAYLKRYGVGLLAGTHGAERDRLTREATAIRGKMDALALEFATEDSDDPVKASRTLHVATRALETKLEGIEQARALLAVPETTLTGIADAEDPARAFLDAGLERQRTIIDLLVTVTILPGTRGRPVPVSKRVMIRPKRTAA